MYIYPLPVRKYDFEITDYYKLNINKKLVDSHFHLDFVKNHKNNNLKNQLAQKLISNKNDTY